MFVLCVHTMYTMDVCIKSVDVHDWNVNTSKCPTCVPAGIKALCYDFLFVKNKYFVIVLSTETICQRSSTLRQELLQDQERTFTSQGYGKSFLKMTHPCICSFFVEIIFPLMSSTKNINKPSYEYYCLDLNVTLLKEDSINLPSITLLVNPCMSPLST